MSGWDWIVIGCLVSVAGALIIAQFMKAGRGIHADDFIKHPDWPRESHTTLRRGPEGPRAHGGRTEARRLERVK